MFVGAIKAEAPLTGAIGARFAGREEPSGRIDFAAVLIAARTGGGGGSAVRTEASRSIAVLGNLRETFVRYTDGTSDVQMSAVSEDRPATIPLMPWRAIDRAQAAFRANSDLAPEIGASADRAARTIWRKRDGPSRAARGSAGRVPNRRHESGAAADGEWNIPENIGVGQLVDRMV